MVFQYDLEYIKDNGEAHTGREYGFLMEEYPVVPSAELVYKTYEIPGRNGELVEAKSYKKNIRIPAQLTLVADDVDQLQYRDYIRRLEAWLSGSGWLRLSDTADCKYRVLKVQNNNNGRTTPVWGTVTPLFLCLPYEFRMDGFYSYPITEIKYNPYSQCKPIYRLYGETAGTLTVNGKTVTINVGQNLTIDSANQITYRTDNNTLVMSGITGDYEDLWLDPGNVAISVSSGLTATIEPRWGWEL